MSASRERLAIALYTGMALIGWGWCVYQGRVNPFQLVGTTEPWRALVFSLALGLAVGLTTVAWSRWATRRWEKFRELQRGFGEMLEGLTHREVFILALTSSIGEEMFFRGAMQPALGLVLTSLIFGGVHIIPQRRFMIWTIWAVVMGFVLGGIFALTGALVGPIVAHFIINYLNLRTIAAARISSTGDTTK